MNRTTKLIILLLLSLSVFFIYQKTNATNIKIVTIGDNFLLGINSYGIKEYSYVDYYKDYLESKVQKVEINNTYSNKEQSINSLLNQIKNTNDIKRELTNAHILILNVGYNDIIYRLTIEEEITPPKYNRIIKQINKEYNELIKEIRKYYKNDIIIVGYPKSNKEDYYSNIGIRNLNNILSTPKNVTFIDTYKLLSNRNKYFSNPNSYYPNREGYKTISNKIIKKTLEK